MPPTPRKATHTPTPWKKESVDIGWAIHPHGNRAPIAIVSQNYGDSSYANAALIVHRVNIHDELVSLLKRANRRIYLLDSDVELFTEIKTFLARATGEKTK